MLIALLFGKITFKELKEHVRKYRKMLRISKRRRAKRSGAERD